MLKLSHLKGLKRSLERKKMVVLGKSPKVIVKALKWMAKKLGPTSSVDFIFNKWLKKGYGMPGKRT
jgi:hypothetical protein